MQGSCLGEVPQEYKCRISGHIMSNPVTTVDGMTFQRSSISEWFSKGNSTNPITYTTLHSKDLIPNKALQTKIKKFKVTLSMQEIQLASRLRQTNTIYDQMKNEWRKMECEHAEYFRQFREKQENFDLLEEYEDGFYIGEFEGKMRHGKGVYNYKDGSRYWGSWKNDLKCGVGIQIDHPTKEGYFGQWKKGKHHGRGALLLHEDHKVKVLYIGSWQEGEKDGQGLEYNPDTKVGFKGTWRKNLKDGEGCQRILHENYNVHYENGQLIQRAKIEQQPNSSTQITFQGREKVSENCHCDLISCQIF